jgi:long-chain acyl-CoA synthetase
MTEEQKLTGFPSVDKPWLKYYSREAVEAPTPACSLYEFMYACNREHPADTALNYFGHRISFGELFAQIDRAARAFLALGVRPGDVVPIVSVSTVASVVCFYALNRIGAVVDFLNVLAERDDLVKYLREAEARVVVTLDLFGEKVVSAATPTARSGCTRGTWDTWTRTDSCICRAG